MAWGGKRSVRDGSFQPNGEGESWVGSWILQVGGFVLFVVILIWFLATFVGFGGSGDGYKEECRTEERAGRIREVCW